MVDSEKTIHFLFAEDDPMLVNLYVDAFKFAGYVLSVAKDGDEALAHLKSADPKPAALLLDIAMPKVSGLEVLEAMKQDPTLKDIPVVVLSNLSDAETEKKARGFGIQTYLVKSDHTPKQVVEKVLAAVKG